MCGPDHRAVPLLTQGIEQIQEGGTPVPVEPRERAWARLDQLADRDKLSSMASVVSLADVVTMGADILAGQVRGRTVVDVRA